jgi:hypothetical protein|tara:strand:+ start:45 stop:395 length:351 start_codon:yes stop_codon:yes gene_type:complete
MKKIAYVGIILSLLINPLSALEKKDCSGLKKLSKAFVTCKSNNFKAGLTNAGSQVKKNTIGKIKKKDTKKDTSTTNKKTEELKSIVNKKTEGFKKKASSIFSGTTKQYPKYTKNEK